MIHYYRYLFVKMKVFNYSELHFSEVTSYKIPTLVYSVERITRNGRQFLIFASSLNNYILCLVSLWTWNFLFKVILETLPQK